MARFLRGNRKLSPTVSEKSPTVFKKSPTVSGKSPTVFTNPHVTIELSAHCDYKGSNEYNKKLSQQRALSVVNYLISKGIAKDRLTPVGYGKEPPKTIRKKMTEQYPWLKEEDNK